MTEGQRRHKWEDSPTKTNLGRKHCVQPDCDLYQYPGAWQEVNGRKWRRMSYKRGRRWTMYGPLGELMPPCGPMTDNERAWLSHT